MPGHFLTALFHAVGLFKFSGQKGQLLHWLGLTG
jgi:hypothetical protein